jgi:hypothetical protein
LSVLQASHLFGSTLFIRVHELQVQGVHAAQDSRHLALASRRRWAALTT